MAKNRNRGTFWLLALGTLGLLIAIVAYLPRARGHEVARKRSPDGAFDAFLLEIDKEAEEGHSYRVCMRPPNNYTPVTLANCDEIAYLGGVSGIGSGPFVTLAWTSPSQLEIRYPNATAIHIYKPVYAWGSGRYRRLPVFTRAVQTQMRRSDVPTFEH